MYACINEPYFSANASAIIKIQGTLDKKPRKLQNIPNDEVFGLTINDNFYRAVKKESLKPNNRENKLFLLDVGESYPLTESSMNFYQLSEDCKKLPAQAILCKMKTVIVCQNMGLKKIY